MAGKTFFTAVLFFMTQHLFSSVHPYAKPLSLGFKLDVAPVFYIYIPEPVPTFHSLFSGQAGTGFTIEYLFTDWFALENSHSFHAGYHYLEQRYYNQYDSAEHQSQLHILNLYYYEELSMLFYFPVKPLWNKLKWMIRLGATLEVWCLSWYQYYENGEKGSEGNFLDDKPDGPNVYQEYLDYRSMINFVNFGPHIGFGALFPVKMKTAILPEIKLVFFPFPVMDGNRVYPAVTGNHSFIIRNDGSDSRALSDYKFILECSMTVRFYTGTYQDSLYQVKKSAKNNMKR